VDGIAGGNATVGTIHAGVAMGGVNNQGNQVLYTAPSGAGSHAIMATSVANPADSASVPVTVAAVAYTVINPGSTFNVTSYGAIGDGARNNGPAFADAIAAASAKGGGVVIVPAAAKPYEIACNLSGFGSYGILLPTNVTLQINAGATVQAMAGAPSVCSLIAVGGTNVNIVGGGTVDGNLASNAGKQVDLVFLGIGSNITVANLTLQNAPQDGIFIQEGLGYTVSDVQLYGLTVTGNARDGLTLDTSSGIVVRDSTFSASGACGIDIEPISGENPTQVSIFNSHFTGNANMGIQSGPDDGGDTGTFTHSVFAFNTIFATNIGIYQGNSKGVSIHNNTINNLVTKTEESFAACGIMLNDSTATLGVTNDLVLGNSITASASNGIYCLNCHDTDIGYNTIIDCGGYGIANLDGSATVEDGTNTGSGNARGNTNGSSF
jgi:polygalacturonase